LTLTSFLFLLHRRPITVIYTLSLHDALPICKTNIVARVGFHHAAGGIRDSIPLPSAEMDKSGKVYVVWQDCHFEPTCNARRHRLDRKSTRLNSSHGSISYAVFCLKKKNHWFKRSRSISLTNPKPIYQTCRSPNLVCNDFFSWTNTSSISPRTSRISARLNQPHIFS